MSGNMSAVVDESGLQAALEDSKQRPVILFKHDPHCPISANAHRQISGVEGDVRVIDVENQKELSMAAAEQTGVTHASPQVLVLRDGRAAWSADLWEITTDAVQSAAGAG